MAIEIKEVSSKRDQKKFIQFQNELYRGNKYYVPTIESDDMITLSREKNPAFEFCEATYFLAYRNGKIVGRIAAIINRVINEKESRRRARFGFVDFIDDKEVVDALFGAVEKWALARGMEELNGPLGFSDLDPEGMLIEGFDQIGTLAAIYNYPYYVEHINRLGFVKDADWIEFKIDIPTEIPEKHKRIAKLIGEKYGLRTIRYTDRKKLARDYGTKLFHLVNEAYDVLYGYSPLTSRQIEHYVGIYLPMLRLEMVTLIVDRDNELVGMAVAIPSLARALQKSRGKLFPFGFIHLLKALKGKNSEAELMLMAVKPEYQNKGLNAFVFDDLIPQFKKLGITTAESNPELELNVKIQNQWQILDPVQHKRRRAFTKMITK